MSSLLVLVRAGHWPSLVAALLHFEVSFAAWVLLGVLAPFAARDLGLSPAVVGLVVATPLLAGAALRVLLGWLADAYGPKRIGGISIALVLVPLAWAWLAADTLVEIFGVGLLLGVAGASFAVSLPLAGSHYPRSHQGLALGVAGAGNSGTIVAGLLAPRLAEHLGWHATFGLALLPVMLAAVAFRLLAKEAPGERVRRSVKTLLSPLRERDCWWLCGLYAVTFGGFVGLASYLPTLIVDRYGVSAVTAGTVSATAAGAGSLLRPVGGLLSDRWGGTSVLPAVYLLAAAGAVALAAVGGFAAGIVLSMILLGALGTGNGAVFQVVSLRFGASLGLVTGVVGAAGGVGGFLLPTLLGSLRQATGSYGLGLALFAAIAAVCVLSVLRVRFRWTQRAGELAVGEGAI